MQYSYIIAAILPMLASALPLEERAGGPAIVPIPANCTIINPLPHANCGVGNVNGYQLNANFVNHHQLYAAYFDGFMPVADQWQQCIEQCYGYGNLGDCKSALLAYNVPTPAGYYGTPGGALETACLLFDIRPNPNSWVPSLSGQYTQETAGNIWCPNL